MIRFAVVTRVPSPQEGGNFAWYPPYLPVPLRDAVARGVQERNLDGESYDLAHAVLPELRPFALWWRAPVFTLGEVLIVDEDGREVAGHRRKASKWDVDVEVFDLLTQAIVRAEEVTAQGQDAAVVDVPEDALS